MKTFKQFIEEGIRDEINTTIQGWKIMGNWAKNKIMGSDQPKKDQSRVPGSEISEPYNLDPDVSPSTQDPKKKRTIIWPKYLDFEDYRRTIDTSAGRRVPDKELGLYKGMGGIEE